MLSSPLAGVNGVYVARMDYQDIDQRKGYSGTEMFWAPSPSQPMQGGVLGFLPYWYYAPGGFDFGGDDGTQPVMDDLALEDYNVPDVVARFNALIDDQVSFTAGQDVMIVRLPGKAAPTRARTRAQTSAMGSPRAGGGLRYPLRAIFLTPPAVPTPPPLFFAR
jgi:hypothetical protein